ncbi:MAG TPA: hypothetical protein VFK05_31190 [Polyangiaceae bacterium]|nr:hypothetical protein [Polyangiaceae bacterium]
MAEKQPQPGAPSSAPARDRPVSPAPASKAQIEARVDAFENRKRYPELTPEILSTIPDAEVEQALG